MSQRQLAVRQNTDVVLPDDNKAEMWQAGANLAGGLLDLKKKQDVANMNNFAAQSQVEMMKATNDWRVKNESNPTDDKAVSELHQSYDTIMGQYDEKVGFLSRGDWSQVKNKLKTGYQQQNIDWSFKQSVKNAETSINDSIKTNLQIATEYGRSGDLATAKKHYADTVLGIDEFANGVIGDESKNKLTTGYRSDYMKSYVMGLAESDPDAALSMITNDEIRKDIGKNEDINTIKSYALKQKEFMRQEVKTSQINTGIEILSSFAERPPTGEDVQKYSLMGAKGEIDPELSASIVRYIVDPGSVSYESDEALVKSLDSIFDSKDKEGIQGALKNILDGGSDKKITKKSVDAAVLVASKRSLSLETEGNGGIEPSSSQGVIDGVYKALKSWVSDFKMNEEKKNAVMKDFMNEVNKSEPSDDPRKIYDMVVKRAVVREHPELAKNQDVPNMVISKDSNIKFVFPSTTNIYPNRIFNPATGKLENNPEVPHDKRSR